MANILPHPRPPVKGKKSTSTKKDNELHNYLVNFILNKSLLLSTYVNDSDDRNNARKNIIYTKYMLSKVHPALYGFCKKSVDNFDKFMIGNVEEPLDYPPYGINYSMIKDNSFNDIGFRFNNLNKTIEFLVKNQWVKFTECEYTWNILCSTYHSIQALQNSNSELQKMRLLNKEIDKYMDLYKVE